MGPGSVLKGIVRRALPAPFIEDRDQDKPVGIDRNGAIHVVPLTRRDMADEGSYFVGSNPTVSTGVAYATTTSLVKTTAMFALFNSARAGGPRSYLDYIRLWLTAVSTGGVSMEALIESDWKDRTPSANNALIPLVGCGDGKPVTLLQAFATGTLTVPTTSVDGRAKTLGRCRIATGLGIVGDEYEFQFGSEHRDAGYQGLTAAELATPARKVGHFAPAFAEPGQWLVFYMWWLTAAGTPSFEYEVGVCER
jgi:hypothetical protein